jgi:hypothetical protein
MHRSLAIALAALVLLEAVLVWRPFVVRASLYQTRWRDNVPAGEIVAGFQVAQDIPGGLVRSRPPIKKSVHWHGLHSLKPLLEPNCFALRFATYRRENTGHVRVDWRQGEASQSWLVATEGLADNAYADFCPRHGIDPRKDSRVVVHGVDGKPGNAVTVWLTRSKLEPALVQGGHAGNRSVAIELSHMRRVGPRRVVSVGGGGFLLACLCSLAIASLALWKALAAR